MNDKISEGAQNENGLLLPKVDFIFKKIFGEEKNKELLKDFLASVLNLKKESITDLKLTNNEIPKEHAEDKSGRLDVRVEMNEPDGSGEKIELDIEIQLEPHNAMSQRVLFYWAKMYTNPFVEGMPYQHLRKTISIIIFDKNFLPLEKYHSKFHIWEDEERLKFADVLEIHVLELQKAMKFIAEKNPPLDGLLSWSVFLSNDNLEVCEMLSAQSAVFEMAVNLQKDLSCRAEIRDFYARRLVDRSDETTRLYDAKHEGINIGVVEGKLETARNMLKEGLNFEMISRVTGLTEAQLRT